MFKRRKKPRKNYRKGAKKKRIFALLRPLVSGFYVTAGIFALMGTSVLFVFTHDVITQCDYFKASSLKMEGMHRLTSKQVAEVARLSKGMNIMAVNLSMARKRLLAHPWIAEAEVRREIPAGLYVSIREHSPLAIVDLGRKYLIDEKGKVFKEWTDSDPKQLPLISGLQLSDFRHHESAAAASSQEAQDGSHPLQVKLPPIKPFEAVMQVLRLGKRTHGILSNNSIKKIRVDREIGITLEIFKQGKTIVLGYHNYPLKYNMLNNILVYRSQRRNFPDFNRIDLNDVNRIVVDPVEKSSAGDHKEV